MTISEDISIVNGDAGVGCTALPVIYETAKKTTRHACIIFR